MTGSLRPTEREVRGAAGGDAPARPGVAVRPNAAPGVVGGGPRGRPSVRSPGHDGSVLDRTVPLGDLLQRVGASPAEGGERPSAAELLAGVCDVSDAVLLAETLLGRFAKASAEPDDGRWMVGHVGEQMASTGRWLERHLRTPHEGRNAIPDAAKLCELAREGRTPAELSAPFAQRWLALSRTIRRDATRVRAEAATELRALGAEASRLERLDAALRRATESATAEREHAAATALVRRFVEGLRDAMWAEHQRREATAETALPATKTETETALRESETETETETALRESETETETETALRATESKTTLRAADSDSDSATNAASGAVGDAALAPFVFDESAYVALPPLEVVRHWYASGFVARMRRDLDALCRATLREETELLAELARGCLSAAEDEARARATSEGEGS